MATAGKGLEESARRNEAETLNKARGSVKERGRYTRQSAQSAMKVQDYVTDLTLKSR
jgi:hypothetical protein